MDGSAEREERPQNKQQSNGKVLSCLCLCSPLSPSLESLCLCLCLLDSLSLRVQHHTHPEALQYKFLSQLLSFLSTADASLIPFVQAIYCATGPACSAAADVPDRAHSLRSVWSLTHKRSETGGQERGRERVRDRGHRDTVDRRGRRGRGGGQRREAAIVGSRMR